VNAVEFREFLQREQLAAATLQSWIAAGWFVERSGVFSEVDLARAQLICDLKRMGVNDDGIPIILDLIDQLHGLRLALRSIMDRRGTLSDS
jgi:chaperone modulatory protein CbpM